MYVLLGSAIEAVATQMVQLGSMIMENLITHSDISTPRSDRSGVNVLQAAHRDESSNSADEIHRTRTTESLIILFDFIRRGGPPEDANDFVISSVQVM